MIPDVAKAMIAVFGGILLTIGFLSLYLTRNPRSSGIWLPSTNNIAKREFETYALSYSACWVAVFGVVIAGQFYLHMDEPILMPSPSECNIPLFSRYSFKANVWIAIFSFIGNYWYTHYFYSVLQAKYTFSSWRLNDVPIPLFFATHFYFVLYHTLSNMILRKIESRYLPSKARTVFFWAVIFAFSYFTAFMETLTISSFPDYSFADQYMAYTVGSAFYGIYFIVSYPVFYRLDEKTGKGVPPYSVYQTVMEAFGASMIVLCLLDFCRLYLAIPLNITGKLFYLFKKA